MMNMDDAKEAFIAESTELLEDMEQALLSLESNPDDESLINAIFRSAHTIKGTSGLFGYDDIVAFTHVVETFLDKIRDRSVIINAQIAALLLTCQDHIKLLVDVAVSGNAKLTTDQMNKGRELSEALAGFAGMQLDKGIAPSTALGEALPAETPTGDQVENNEWHISIRFNHGVLTNGMEPLSFFRYLTRLGDLVGVAPVTEGLPTPDEFNPEHCYLGFELRLCANTDKRAIESVFEFVMEDCQLHILPPKALLSHYVELIRKMSGEEMRLGEILVACGALTEHELQRALEMQSEGPAKSAKLIGDVLKENHDVDAALVDAAVAAQQSGKEKAMMANRSIRVDAGKLGEQINLVGELVIAGARARLLARQTGDEELIESILSMERLVEQIRDSALRLRMVQIGDSFKRFPRIVRDVAADLKKEIRLVINGEETELDKTLVEKIGDPLMHLVRNSMDHGLETPEQRLAVGKPAQGTLELNAYHDSGSIVIEVRDDGRGLSKEKILAKAIERGLVSEGEVLSDSDIYQLIFEPGFSTADQVTNLSGRGVGMDVVKKNIQAVRGTVEIASRAGQGTTVSIRLPLTLAIIDGFLVQVADASYVIPLDSVVECIELTQQHYDAFVDHQFIKLRGDLLPYIRLSQTFGVKREGGGRENIVVVQCGEVRAGLVVDDLLGEFQTVIKPMGKVFERLKGVSGATILGSGEVAVILDVPALISKVKGHPERHTSGMVA